jgi:hypothetical protein
MTLIDLTVSSISGSEASDFSFDTLRFFSLLDGRSSVSCTCIYSSKASMTLIDLTVSSLSGSEALDFFSDTLCFVLGCITCFATLCHRVSLKC